MNVRSSWRTGDSAAQDAIDVSGDATPDVYPVGPVGEQTAVSGNIR